MRLNSDQCIDALLEVAKERLRQENKWGEQNHHPFRWLSILTEEVGEAAQAANDTEEKGAHWAHYREELIQVAAVAVAMVESYDRNQGGK